MSSNSETAGAEARARLPLGVALHARPAGAFVREATRLAGVVTISANGRRANAKSILEVLSLGATGGTELVISASGEDATVGVEHLAAFVSGLS